VTIVERVVCVCLRSFTAHGLACECYSFVVKCPLIESSSCAGDGEGPAESMHGAAMVGREGGLSWCEQGVNSLIRVLDSEGGGGLEDRRSTTGVGISTRIREVAAKCCRRWIGQAARRAVATATIRFYRSICDELSRYYSVVTRLKVFSVFWSISKAITSGQVGLRVFDHMKIGDTVLEQKDIRCTLSSGLSK